MPVGYSYVLSEVATNFALGLPRKEQHRFAMVCRILADSPHRNGDYVTTDHAGRILQNLLIDDWVITYWTDHATKELRIVELVQV